MMRIFRLMPLKIWLITMIIYILPVFLTKTENISIYHILIWFVVLIPVFIFSYYYGLWGGVTFSFLSHILHIIIDKCVFLPDNFNQGFVFRHEVFAVSLFLSVCISILSHKIKQKDLQILHLNQQRFDLFFDNTTDALFMINLKGCLVKVNHAFEELVGYSKEDMSQENFESFFSSVDESGKSLEYFNQALQGEPQRGEIAFKHKHGHRIFMDVIAIPEFDEDKVNGICMICKDITEHKNVTEILLDDPGNTVHIFNKDENYSIFIVELTANSELGRILDVNHMACKKLKYVKEELLSRNYKSLLPPGSKYILATKQMPKLFSEGNFSTRTTHVDRNANKLPVKIYARFFKHHDRDAVLILAEDISLQDNALMKDDIGKNLRILMAEMDISTTELSEMSGLSLTTISNLKNGKISKPKISTIQAIADALGISPSEICNIDDYEL
jgi:PAS domain S-box-containing protein